MMTNKDFIDYYEVLQISPRAELETIKRVFKLLAVRVHPDNPTSGDADQFRLIKRRMRHFRTPASAKRTTSHLKILHWSRCQCSS